MAQILVRNTEDRVTETLRVRAKTRGSSLEKYVRGVPATSTSKCWMR